MQQNSRIKKAQQIRDVIRYLKQFNNATIVIYLDDEVIDSPLFSSHMRDIALIHQAGLRVVIVPGARKRIDQILIKQCGLDKNYFSYKSDDGENLLIQKELLFDPLDAYEVLSQIESICKILINDEIIFNPNMTYGEFIDVFYNEMEREKHGYA